MNCSELDDFRNQPGSAHASLSPAAQRHLRECEACRKLQEFWQSKDPDAEPSPEMLSKIAESIFIIPVTPLQSEGSLYRNLLLRLAIAVAAGAALLGAAGWHAMAPLQLVVDFTLLALGSVLSARFVVRQMAPAALYALPPALVKVSISAAILAELLLLFPYAEDPAFVIRGLKCWSLALLASTFAAILFAGMLRRAAWLSPTSEGAAAGLLAGFGGLIVIEIYCPVLDRAHRGLWHFGATLTAALLGLLAGILLRHHLRKSDALHEH